MTLSCARVAVCVPVQGTFTYAVPGHLEYGARVGCRIMVPFGNRRVTGYVLERVPCDGMDGLKEVLETPDGEPFFHPGLVPLFEWMAGYYLHPVGLVIQACLPAGLTVNSFKGAVLTDKGREALASLPAESEDGTLLAWVAAHPGRRPPCTLSRLNSLGRAGLVLVEDRVNRREAGPLMERFVRPGPGVEYDRVAEVYGPFKAAREQEFLETVYGSEATLLRDLTGRFSNGAYLVRKWTDKGVLERFSAPVVRDPAGSIMFHGSDRPVLYPRQQEALTRITRGLDGGGFRPMLLFGVTGSGKTEVYCRAVEHAVSLGRQALVMVPEISLATYMEGFFRMRLGRRIAMYHSGLSRGERYDQWMRMARGEVDLVIGARSALFAPLPRLGLIVVDEEFDGAYKQEHSPRYQARDAAVVRAKLEKAVVVLGSGTPSIQSFHHAVEGRYELVTMPERVDDRPLPEVRVVDMKRAEDARSDAHMLSPELKAAVARTLEDGAQAVLFLNRRGFHRLFICRACGNPVRCPNCSVALTYHLKEDHLTCHYCGFTCETRTKCTTCGTGTLRSLGFGTEKVEQELQALFPEARVARMDADSTRKKGVAVGILKQFSRRRLDILVGTQMITKGYDFPAVTLVGVIGADFSLGFPDFRAGERTFQLLAQAAGRAGRGTRTGTVIVQTFNPEHYAIRTAAAHDFRTFFEEERSLRAQLGYPPFTHVACLRIEGKEQEGTEEAADELGSAMRAVLEGWPTRGREVRVLGPVEAPLARLKGRYRRQILVKCTRTALLSHFLGRVEALAGKDLEFHRRGIRLVVDVDPYQML